MPSIQRTNSIQPSTGSPIAAAIADITAHLCRFVADVCNDDTYIRFVYQIEHTNSEQHPYSWLAFESQITSIAELSRLLQCPLQQHASQARFVGMCEIEPTATG